MLISRALWDLKREQVRAISNAIFKVGHPWPLFRLILVLIKQTSVQFLHKINVKNVRPVYTAWI